MAWVRIDDHFDEHPKLAKVGPLGWGFWIAGLAYCNRNLTDGFIPRSIAMSLGHFEVIDGKDELWQLSATSGHNGYDLDAPFVIDLLVGAGLWDVVPGGYQVHDYTDFQPTKEKVVAERARSAERQGRFRAKQPSNGVSNAKRNGVSNRPVTLAPTPNPTLRKEEPLSSEVEGLCQRLARKIRANDLKATPNPESSRWLTDMRLLVNDRGGDRAAVVEVARIIDWCQADPFWRTNILSPAKLRKQFTQLVLKAQGVPQLSDRRSEVVARANRFQPVRRIGPA